MNKGKFEYFLDKAGEYRFHLRAPNGEIIGASQGYNQKSGCLHGIESVRMNAVDAELVDLTEGGKAGEAMAAKPSASPSSTGASGGASKRGAGAIKAAAAGVGASAGASATASRVSAVSSHKKMSTIDTIWGLIGVGLAVLAMATVLMIMF